MLGEDDVVEDFYAEDFSGLLEGFGYLQILCRWLEVTTGMVVCQDYGRSSVGDSIGENLSRVDLCLVDEPDGDDSGGDYLSCSVQADDDEMLLLAVAVVPE